MVVKILRQENFTTILAACEEYLTCQGFLTECTGTWFIVSMPVTELVATSLNALSELIESNTTKNSAHNVQPINIMKMK